MMRHNRISKLLLLLIIPSLLGLIFTCIFRGYTANWIQILCYSFAPLVSSIIVAICFRGRWMGLLLLWTFVASVAFNVPLQNWLFHSADDIVRYASITDLYKEKDKPMYFTFDRLEVDNKVSSVFGVNIPDVYPDILIGRRRSSIGIRYHRFLRIHYLIINMQKGR